MKSSQFFQDLAAQRWHVVGNAAYGVQDAYPFAIRQLQNKKTLTVSVTVQSPPDKDAARALRDALKQQGVKATINGRLLSYPLRICEESTAEVVREGLRAVIAQLRQAGFAPPCQCGICGQGGTDAFILRDMPPMGYDAVHARCVDQLQSGAVGKVRENPGSYLTGLLGALAGALVGALPAFLVVNFFQIVSAWLFMLLPIASYFGYKLCRGKMNAVAGIASVVFSILGLAAVILAWDVSVNMSEFGLGLGEAWRLTARYTFQGFEPEYWAWITPDLGTVVMFYLLGIVCSFGVISRTNRSELSSMEQLRATMLVRVDPNAPQRPAAPAASPLPEQVPWEL